MCYTCGRKFEDIELDLTIQIFQTKWSLQTENKRKLWGEPRKTVTFQEWIKKNRLAVEAEKLPVQQIKGKPGICDIIECSKRKVIFRVLKCYKRKKNEPKNYPINVTTKKVLIILIWMISVWNLESSISKQPFQWIQTWLVFRKCRTKSIIITLKLMSIIKENKILSALIWMKLEHVILSETRQALKGLYDLTYIQKLKVHIKEAESRIFDICL